MARTTARTRSTAPSTRGGFDFAQLAQSETTEVQITHPITGEDTGIRITVRPLHGRHTIAWLNAEPKDKSVDRDLELAILCTVAWRDEHPDDDQPEGTIRFGDEFLACTPENVRRIYGDDRFLIVRSEQIEKAIGDKQRFFSAPKSS